MNEKMIKVLEEEVEKKLGNGCAVQFQKIKKNNGVELPAIIITELGMNVSPVIYIDGMMRRFEQMEMDIHEMAYEIVGIYKSQCDINYFQGIIAGMSKENILDKVIYKVVNREKNRSFLADKPYKAILDLAAVYIIAGNIHNDGTFSIVITHELCGKYGINEGELDAAARQNTELQGFTIQSMASILAEMMGIPECEMKYETPMVVFTNHVKMYGAAVMLYNSYFKKLSDRLDSDLYILPSSIHEVIAVPTDKMDQGDLRDMVREININEVEESEVLGENVYIYSREKGTLEIA